MTNFKSVKGLFGYKLDVTTERERKIENYIKPIKNLGSKYFKVVAGENGISIVSKSGEELGVFDEVCHEQGFKGSNQYFTAKKGEKVTCFDSANERTFPVIFQTVLEIVDEDGHIFDIYNGEISKNSRPDKVMVKNGRARYIDSGRYLSLSNDGYVNIMRDGEVEVEKISQNPEVKISCVNRANTCALGTSFIVDEGDKQKVYSQKLGRFVFETSSDSEISREDNSKNTILVAYDAKAKKSKVCFFVEDKGAVREYLYEVPAKVIASFYGSEVGACVEFFRDGKRAYLDKDGKDVTEAVAKYLKNRKSAEQYQRELRERQAKAERQTQPNGEAEAKMIAGLTLSALDKHAVGNPLFVEGVMKKIEEEIQKEN